jgi:hypothetical protein
VSRSVVLAVLGCAAIVHAQPPEFDERAAELFKQGRELAQQGDYAGACRLFAESFARDHATGTELNLGDCHEHLNHNQIAWHFYDAAATEFGRANDKRAKYARDHADALLPKLATVVVKLAAPAPAGLVVTIGGRTITPPDGVTTLSDRFDPGEVAVTIAAPDKPAVERTARGIAGATVVVDVPPFEASGAPVDTPRLGSRRRGRVKLAAAFAIGGGAFAIAAITVGAVARNNYRAVLGSGDCFVAGDGALDCKSQDAANRIDSARKLGDVGTVFGVLAAACGGTAALVYLTAPRDVVVAPTASGRGIGVTLTKRF